VSCTLLEDLPQPFEGLMELASRYLMYLARRNLIVSEICEIICVFNQEIWFPMSEPSWPLRPCQLALLMSFRMPS
jgi:hypothetical protein